MGALNKALVALSYKTGIPYAALLEEPGEIIDQYFEILAAEIEAMQKMRK